MVFKGTRSGSLQVGVFIKFVVSRVSPVDFMAHSQLANHNPRGEHNRQIRPWPIEEITNLPSSRYSKVIIEGLRTLYVCQDPFGHNFKDPIMSVRVLSKSNRGAAVRQYMFICLIQSAARTK